VQFVQGQVVHPRPGAYVWQTPAAHTSLFAHWLRQPPQFDGSVFVSTHPSPVRPVPGADSQSVLPALHVVSVTHAAPSHTLPVPHPGGMPVPVGHAPHA
jgi:hypothetical protein